VVRLQHLQHRFGADLFGFVLSKDSAGAEQAGASLIVSEFAPPARRGFYAALPFAGCIVGILLANGIFTLVQSLPKEEFS
jgi:MFS family permease